MTFTAWLPAIAIAVMSLVLLVFAHRALFASASELGGDGQKLRQLGLLGLTVVAVVFVLAAMPLGSDTRQTVFAILGLLLTGVFAFASTSFVSNAMAGLMLRTVSSYRLGDFIRVGDHVGRVTERGLFHTEIQTEDRDLMTLPNLMIAGQPVRVVRASGTVVSARVSIGYDVPHGRVTSALLQAATAVGIEDPFAQIEALGDFSVAYRVAGFHAGVRDTGLLAIRSDLNRAVLDALHGAGIEIVSPTFMNQRPLAPEARVLPEPGDEVLSPTSDARPEVRIFDKAVKADRVEHLRVARADLADEIRELDARLADSAEGERPGMERELRRLRAHLTAMDRAMDARLQDLEDDS